MKRAKRSRFKKAPGDFHCRRCADIIYAGEQYLEWRHAFNGSQTICRNCAMRVRRTGAGGRVLDYDCGAVRSLLGIGRHDSLA